ncbi:MAG: hypothetical protein HC819_13285 [Cyclobacteriaceae bacterium]|nr:hypothetical protein [Cyclobacteriaceae bacterium]
MNMNLITRINLMMVLAMAVAAPVYAQSNNHMSLNATWQLTYANIHHGPSTIEKFIRSSPLKDPARYIDAPVPMEIHQLFQNKGIIQDVNVGLNTFKANWIEDQYWQYFRQFEFEKSTASKRVWLVFERLDLVSTIILNGVEVGAHKNVHIPCRIDVTDAIKEGTNELMVGIESGYYYTRDLDGEGYREVYLDEKKRHWLRKAQYEVGWDWNPQLINVGITGDVYLQWSQVGLLEQTKIKTSLDENLQTATIELTSYIDQVEAEAEKIQIEVSVRETGEVHHLEVDAAPGLKPYRMEFTIARPTLWWPLGYGDQFLYHFDLTASVDGAVIDKRTLRTGIRKVELDQSKHPVEGKYFIIRVNNTPIFCKGSNWVPPDMIHSRVTDEKIEKLVDLSVDANFNMLRIWGGGVYAPDRLMDLCDERGILVWHDFMFACMRYPVDNADFVEQVKEEVTWVVREYSPHPSLVLWCGNNELEMFMWDWDRQKTGKPYVDLGLFHIAIPQIVLGEDVDQIYWPSSPYSPDFKEPNDPTVGDQHPWGVPFAGDTSNIYAYRDYVDRFPNEGGFLGATSPATLRQFLPDDQESVRSLSWEHHDNHVNFRYHDEGLTYKTIKYWLGKDYRSMSFDDYVYSSALMHSEALTEYITNYRRRMFSSSAAIFWMFSDSWPVTHGWTIVDYYLRKKLAYHPVKRAFEPVSTVVAVEDDTVKIFGVNDSQLRWQGTLRYGLFGMAGGKPVDVTKEVVLSPNQSIQLASFAIDTWKELDETRHGAFAVLSDGSGKTVSQHRLFTKRFHEMEFAKPEIQVKKQDNQWVFSSNIFAWGVTLDLDGESSITDNCFDLIPGVAYTVPMHEGKNETPKIIYTGNALMRHD